MDRHIARWSVLYATYARLIESDAANNNTRLTALFLGLPGWAGTRKNETSLDL